MERILCSGLQAERAEQSWQQKGRELGQYPNCLLPELHSLFILSVVYAFLIHLLIPSGCTTLHSVNMNKTTLRTGQWQLGKPWNVSRGRSFNRPSAKGWLWWRQAVAGNRGYILALCCHCVRFGQWTWDGVFLVLKGENITVQRMCSVRRTRTFSRNMQVWLLIPILGDPGAACPGGTILPSVLRQDLWGLQPHVHYPNLQFYGTVHFAVQHRENTVSLFSVTKSLLRMRKYIL